LLSVYLHVIFMDQDRITALRIINQQLTDSKFKSVKELAGWMGALQAQDYNMSKWALGIRLQDSTEADINMEINKGGIIRTHLLRPTWHVVSADDIYWILELTAPRIKASSKTRDKQLGLTESIYSKCNRIFEKSLRDGNHQTREELISELKNSKIDVKDNRASHIFMRAELDGLICSGKQKEGRATYALLEEWVPEHNKKLRDESLKELARRYFTSHGPATMQDFTWWSGLSVSDVKLALDFNNDNLVTEVIQDKTYRLAKSCLDRETDFHHFCFLPAFDEFLISYRDRSAALSFVDNKKAISDNGIFYPTILFNGKVVGTWKRQSKSGKVILNTQLFKIGSSDLDKAIQRSSDRYAGFLGREIELL
jgi:hypothetical protein